MTDFTYFPDVANVNGPVNLWGAVACIAKASQGNWFTDDQYLANKAQMVGRPFAAYHWVDTTDIDSQADYCLNIVGTETPIMTDAEALGATVEHVAEFTRQVRRRGGKCTLTYIPKWYWQKIGSPDLTPLARMSLSLISSNYVDMSQGFLPYGGMTPAIHQFTDAFNLNGKSVDFNRFPGNVQQLETLFNGGQSMSKFLASVSPTGAYVAGTDVVFLSDGFQYRGIGQKALVSIGQAQKLWGAPIPCVDMGHFLALCGVPWNQPNPSNPLVSAEDIASAVATEEGKRLSTPPATPTPTA